MDLKILRLASDTKSQKKISDFTHNSKAKNPLCGDEIQLFFKVNKGKLPKFHIKVKIVITAKLLQICYQVIQMEKKLKK